MTLPCVPCPPKIRWPSLRHLSTPYVRGPRARVMTIDTATVAWLAGMGTP